MKKYFYTLLSIVLFLSMAYCLADTVTVTVYVCRGEDAVYQAGVLYPGYEVEYLLDGVLADEDVFNHTPAVRVKFTADDASKQVTADAESVELTGAFLISDIESTSNGCIFAPFVVNFPMPYCVELLHEEGTECIIRNTNIRPTGEDSIWTANFIYELPEIEPGNYTLRLMLDSGYCGYPELARIPVMITEEDRTDEFQAVFIGNWDKIDSEQQRRFEEVFYTVYPRLFARFGMENDARTVYLVADQYEEGVAYTWDNVVVISTEYVKNHPEDLGFLTHELTHVVQGYTGRMEYDSDSWLTENLANYGRFRYFHWTDEEHLLILTPYDPELADWGYAPYGRCTWFFAYLDYLFPSVRLASGEIRYGLIDSINRMIKTHTGELLSDNPYDPSTELNRLVYEVTGYQTIDELRQAFAVDLRSETWQFTGFTGYRDNFLTEGADGAPAASYPHKVYREKKNLLSGAKVIGSSGYTRKGEEPERLIDGDMQTKWCCTLDTVTDSRFAENGAVYYIAFDLGREEAFNSYRIVNTQTVEPYYGNMTGWEMYISHNGANWVLVDTRENMDCADAIYSIKDQTARYVMFMVKEPDNGQAGTIRLYEMMLYMQ